MQGWRYYLSGDYTRIGETESGQERFCVRSQKEKEEIRLTPDFFFFFLRGEIESGYSSIRFTVYVENVRKLCTLPKIKIKFLKKS